MSSPEKAVGTVPDFRAVYLRRSLRVVKWNEPMATPDQLEESLGQGVRFGEYEPVLFDLYRLPEDEWQLSIRAYGNKGRFRDAEEALALWAAQTGYSRIWNFDGDPFRQIAPEAGLPAAEIHCPCCSMIYEWDQPAFWEQVKLDGYLEAVCPTCGTQLPQWTYEGEEVRDAEASQNACEYLKDLFREDQGL
jgi:hypothetical protein